MDLNPNFLIQKTYNFFHEGYKTISTGTQFCSLYKPIKIREDDIVDGRYSAKESARGLVAYY